MAKLNNSFKKKKPIKNVNEVFRPITIYDFYTNYYIINYK